MKIALVGNQNSGKSSLFNTLTNTNQEIGNWAGVTVEKKLSTIIQSTHQIIDLPGIYSLYPFTKEEEITKLTLLSNNIDLIINVIDSTSIERSLYLTIQLMELDINILIVLTMMDLVTKKGIIIDITKLEELLKIKCIKKEQDIAQKINRYIENIPPKYPHLTYTNELEHAIQKLKNENKYPRYKAICDLESNTSITFFQKRQHLEKKYNKKIDTIIANERYAYAKRISDDVSKRKKTTNSTDILDKIFLNKWASIPIFMAIMGLIYFISISLTSNLTNEIEPFFQNFIVDLNAFLINTGLSEITTSLLCQGILRGVLAILTFIPQVLVLFICISILEYSGYMTRIAFILDRLFKRIGLNGQSLIPFIVGSGCSVQGILSSRIIKNDSERKMTVVLTPLIPCSAKLPIIAAFSATFFKDNTAIISVSIYFIAILTIIVSARVMKKNYYTEDSLFITELPSYKVPNIKNVITNALNKTIEFIYRIQSVILISSIIIWFTLSFSWNFEYGIRIEESILASIGKLFTWFFYPMIGTTSWEVVVATLQGIIAKEGVISTIAIINGANQDISTNQMFNFFTPQSAFSFVIFNLFSIPCLSTLKTMRQELGSKKELIRAIVMQIIIAWVISTSLFQISRLIGVIF